MIVGPSWKGETPAGITAVVRSSTPLVFVVPRIFMNDTAEDHAAVQAPVSQVIFYPLSQFDGKMKTKDWSKLPHFPAPETNEVGPRQWVNPETFFDELPAVMKSIPPLPGEEAADKESNWLPAPSGPFSLYLRGYWADKVILDGTWQPPAIEKVK
jgi:hypothetical protein